MGYIGEIFNIATMHSSWVTRAIAISVLLLSVAAIAGGLAIILNGLIKTFKR